MTKTNLPQTNEMLDKASRYLELILKPEKSQGEQSELNDLINELEDHIVDASEWNYKLDKDGNAASATKWNDEIKLSVDGDATGSVDIDGSKNVTITLTISDFLKITGGLMTGILQAHANNNHGTPQVRNIICKPTPFNAAECNDGDIWFQIES